MIKGVYFCAVSGRNQVFSPEQQKAIAQRLDVSDQHITRENWKDHTNLLEKFKVLLSTWGGATLDEELLDAMPNLKMYFYGAGSIHGIMTAHAWKRGIRITSAAALNAVPVAEFVLAQIILSRKNAWEYMQRAKNHAPDLWGLKPSVQGMYGAKVGLVGFGMIARKVNELLKSFDVEVYASTLFPPSSQDDDFGVDFISTEEIFMTCNVISLHLPLDRSTKGLIGRKLLNHMRPGTTLINTARGEVVNQAELIDFLRARPDVYACIDVMYPEPPERGSVLYELHNVVLTPHLAGSAGNECWRMGQFILEEVDRYLAGRPLLGEVKRSSGVEDRNGLLI